ncbi:hypothetical protein C1H46_019225 [Malus baccata]|uniref:Uncharacterized protein n=1 Tax=Malus baccata TaxID=106549 RepID=A0A540M8Y2_MALBA|nr:hypothetical protein C1H46_019225 [Malus baccata]
MIELLRWLLLIMKIGLLDLNYIFVNIITLRCGRLRRDEIRSGELDGKFLRTNCRGGAAGVENLSRSGGFVKVERMRPN